MGEIRPVLRVGGVSEGRAVSARESPHLPKRDSEEADLAGAIGQPPCGAEWANKKLIRVR